MSVTFTGTTTFVVVNCYKCHVQFGVTSDMNQELRDSHAMFYCPNGHGQLYNGPTEAQRLKRELERVDSDRARIAANYETERRMRLTAERGTAIISGKHRKLKERVAAGLCPCCNRPFANMLAHIHKQHPEYVKETGHGGGKLSE